MEHTELVMKPLEDPVETVRGQVIFRQHFKLQVAGQDRLCQYIQINTK